ncbi:MAG: GNAT family N-acetyltransferase [Crocinitomicaceae bacterium]|jgi:RimJ/RimL family protein N-acetyltransferase|nr:GNAT family N-acetyltransferase [Crocinitomicaceae bacterium]
MENRSNIQLRELVDEDAGFILKLVNEKGWKDFIGERNVHTLQDSIQYIHKIRGTLTPVMTLGYFAFCHEDQQPLGVVGVLQRNYLDHPDVGYAILKQHEGKGFTKKACVLLLTQFHAATGQQTIQAMVQSNNPNSMYLLKSLGFQSLGERELDGEMLCLFDQKDVRSLFL